MKKIIGICIILMLVCISLSGCSEVKEKIGEETQMVSGVLDGYDYIEPVGGVVGGSVTIIFEDGETHMFKRGRLSEFALFCESHLDEEISIWFKWYDISPSMLGREITDFKLGVYEE